MEFYLETFLHSWAWIIVHLSPDVRPTVHDSVYFCKFQTIPSTHFHAFTLCKFGVDFNILSGIIHVKRSINLITSLLTLTVPTTQLSYQTNTNRRRTVVNYKKSNIMYSNTYHAAWNFTSQHHKSTPWFDDCPHSSLFLQLKIPQHFGCNIEVL